MPVDGCSERDTGKLLEGTASHMHGSPRNALLSDMKSCMRRHGWRCLKVCILWYQLAFRGVVQRDTIPLSFGQHLGYPVVVYGIMAL